MRLLLCLLLILPAYATEVKKTICLNMIVKNESKVIKRCLASVKPFIDSWVIVDTGSTDGTQEIIRQYMAGIPGELHEREWKNFEHNRNQALELAKGKTDYLLFMDADEYLELSPDFKFPSLVLDYYDSTIRGEGDIKLTRVLLIKDSLDWKWHGVLHEVIKSPQAKTKEVVPGLIKVSRREGARSQDPLKYQKDAKILEEALKEDPTNQRYVFYLAQSYRDAQDNEAALKTYEKRAKMGGWDQEVFYSLLQMGLLKERLKKDAKSSYLEAFTYRPTRAEPLYHLARLYRLEEDYQNAYDSAKKGLSIPYPTDILFVDPAVYDHGLLFELSISSYWIGNYEESQKLCQQLLAKPNLPAKTKEMVERNITFANAKLFEQEKKGK